MKHLFDMESNTPCCVAVGHFDGVHKGHLSLARRLSAEAKTRGISSVLVSLYRPDALCFTTEKEKALLFQKCGVDTLFSLAESKTIQSMPPSVFVDLILKKRLNAKVLLIGSSQNICNLGIETISFPMVSQDGLPITTEYLLNSFSGRDWEHYTSLCGHPYLMLGRIVHGRQLGRTVGMPTANLLPPGYKRMPPEGVYATISKIDNSKIHMGLTNVGTRPTVDSSNQATVETYLLDTDCNLYGKTQILEFYIYIRRILKFDNLRQVKAQVDQDLLQVRGRLTQIIEKYRFTAENLSLNCQDHQLF